MANVTQLFVSPSKGSSGCHSYYDNNVSKFWSSAFLTSLKQNILPNLPLRKCWIIYASSDCHALPMKNYSRFFTLGFVFVVIQYVIKTYKSFSSFSLSNGPFIHFFHNVISCYLPGILFKQQLTLVHLSVRRLFGSFLS